MGSKAFGLAGFRVWGIFGVVRSGDVLSKAWGASKLSVFSKLGVVSTGYWFRLMYLAAFMNL